VVNRYVSITPGRFIAEMPHCWKNYWRARNQRQNAPDYPVFLDELSSPLDKNQLVSVFFDGWSWESWQFYARIHHDNRDFMIYLEPMRVRGAVEPGSWRLFAGQFDPADPSHFTIPMAQFGLTQPSHEILISSIFTLSFRVLARAGAVLVPPGRVVQT
jgi:hypothetical protein